MIELLLCIFAGTFGGELLDELNDQIHDADLPPSAVQIKQDNICMLCNVIQCDVVFYIYNLM